MSLHSIKDLNKLNDPIKQFQVKFYLSNGITSLTNLVSTGKNILFTEDFELRCTSFTLPGAKISQDEIVLGAHAVQRPTYQDRSGVFSVRVVEDMDAQVLMGIYNWMNRIADTATGIRGIGMTYIANGCIEFIGSKKHLGGISGKTRELVSKLWDHTGGELFGKTSDEVKLYLHGVYPISIEPLTINPSSSDAIEWDIKFNVDWWGEDNTWI